MSWFQRRSKARLILEADEAVEGVAEAAVDEAVAVQKLMNLMNKKPKKLPVSHAEVVVNEADPVETEEMIKVSSSTNELRAWMTKDKNNVS